MVEWRNVAQDFIRCLHFHYMHVLHNNNNNNDDLLRTASLDTTAGYFAFLDVCDLEMAVLFTAHHLHMTYAVNKIAISISRTRELN